MEPEQENGQPAKVKRSSLVSFRKSFSSMIDTGSSKNKPGESALGSNDRASEDATSVRQSSAAAAGVPASAENIPDVAGSEAASSPKQKKSKRFSLKGVKKMFRSNSMKSSASNEGTDVPDVAGAAEDSGDFDESRMSEASASNAGTEQGVDTATGVPKKKKSKIFSTKAITKMFRSNSLTSANGVDGPEKFSDVASLDENGKQGAPKRKSFFSFKKENTDKNSISSPAVESAARAGTSAVVDDKYSGPVSPTFERASKSVDEDEEVTVIDAAQLANSSFFNPSQASPIGKAVSPVRSGNSNNSAAKLFEQVDEEVPIPSPPKGSPPKQSPPKSQRSSPKGAPQAQALAAEEEKEDEAAEGRRDSYTSTAVPWSSAAKETRGRMGSIREEDVEAESAEPAAPIAPVAPVAPVRAAVSPVSARTKATTSPTPARANPKLASPVVKAKQPTPAVTPQPVPVVQLTIPDSELFTSPEPAQPVRVERASSMQSDTQSLSPMQGASVAGSESGSGKAKKSGLFKSAAKMIRRSILGSPAGAGTGTGAVENTPPPPPPPPQESPPALSAAEQDALLLNENDMQDLGVTPQKSPSKSTKKREFDAQANTFRSASARSSPVPSTTSSRSPEKFIFDIAQSQKAPSEVSAPNEPPKSVFVIDSVAGTENPAELKLSFPSKSESELAALLVAPNPAVPVAKLILRNNSIVSPERFSFSVRFDHLTDLDLGYNNITGAIKGLPQTLLRLDLSHNRITNVSGVLNCVDLVELNLSHNDIKSFHSLPAKLERLDLAHNSISAAMTLRTLALSPGIKHLDLRGNTVILEVVEWKVVLRTILTHLMDLNGRPIPKPKKPIAIPTLTAKTASPPKSRTNAAAVREEQRVNDAVRTRMHAIKLELLKESQETVSRTMAPKMKTIRPDQLDQLSKRLSVPTKALTHKATAPPLQAPLFSNRDLVQRKQVQPLASTASARGEVDLSAWMSKTKHSITRAVKAIIRAVRLSDEEEVDFDDIMNLSGTINRLELFSSRDPPLKVEYAIEKLVDGDVLKRKVATVREQCEQIGQLLQQVDSALLLSAQGAFKLRDAVDSAMNSGPGLITYTTLLRSYEATFDPSILTSRRGNSPRLPGGSTVLGDNQQSFVDDSTTVDDSTGDARQRGAANSYDEFSYRVKDYADSRNSSPNRAKPAASSIREGFAESKESKDTAGAVALTPEAFLDRVRNRMTSRAFFGTAAQTAYEEPAAGSEGEAEAKVGTARTDNAKIPPSALFADDDVPPPPPPPLPASVEVSEKKTAAQAAAERVAARVGRSLSQRNLESAVTSSDATTVEVAEPSVVSATAAVLSTKEEPPAPAYAPYQEPTAEAQVQAQLVVEEDRVVEDGRTYDTYGYGDNEDNAGAAYETEDAPYESYGDQGDNYYQYEEDGQYANPYQSQNPYADEGQNQYQQEQYRDEEQDEDQREAEAYRNYLYSDDTQEHEEQEEQEEREVVTGYAQEHDYNSHAAEADDAPTSMPAWKSTDSESPTSAPVPTPAAAHPELTRGISEYSLASSIQQYPLYEPAAEIEHPSFRTGITTLVPPPLFESDGLDAAFLVPPEPVQSAPAVPLLVPSMPLATEPSPVVGTGSAAASERTPSDSPVPVDDAGEVDTSKMSAKDRIKARLAKNKKS